MLQIQWNTTSLASSRQFGQAWKFLYHTLYRRQDHLLLNKVETYHFMATMLQFPALASQVKRLYHLSRLCVPSLWNYSGTNTGIVKENVTSTKLVQNAIVVPNASLERTTSSAIRSMLLVVPAGPLKFGAWVVFRLIVME